MSTSPLFDCLAHETGQPVPQEAAQLYQHFCAHMHRPEGALAGLFYGSALWKTPDATSVWDLYVLVDAYASMRPRGLARFAGALLPPNVYYHECCAEDGTVLRGKIAVMTLVQFGAHCRGGALAPQTWARFAQPARILGVANEQARSSVLAALAQAVLTFHRATAPWVTHPLAIADFWQLGLTQTYASEWRAERGDRQRQLVEATRVAFEMRSQCALDAASVGGLLLQGGVIHATGPAWQARVMRAQQRLRNAISKLQHLLRLMKAAFTFAGGIDYLVYKIDRHSGVRLTPSAFARAYPLLGVWPLVLKGLRARAFR